MKKAIFLDRDGVINEVLTDRVKFVNNKSQFYLIDGVGEAIYLFNQLNYDVFVVTNQGGVGLGYMSEHELYGIHEEMHEQLLKYNAVIKDVLYCPHKPDAHCPCRKPSPKMVLDLAKKHHINLSKSYLVGDRCVDIETGKAAHVKTVLVGKRDKDNCQPDYYFNDLYSFAISLEKLLD